MPTRCRRLSRHCGRSRCVIYLSCLEVISGTLLLAAGHDFFSLDLRGQSACPLRFPKDAVCIVASGRHAKGSKSGIRHHHFHSSIYGRCLRRSCHPPLAFLLCYEESLANTFPKPLHPFHFTQKIPSMRHGNLGPSIPRSARAATGSRSCRTAAEANGVHHDEHWAAAGELLAEGGGPHLRAIALSLPSGGGARALFGDAWPLASGQFRRACGGEELPNWCAVSVIRRFQKQHFHRSACGGIDRTSHAVSIPRARSQWSA